MLLREAVFWFSKVREIGLLLTINTDHVKNFLPYVIFRNSFPWIVKAQETQRERERDTKRKRGREGEGREGERVGEIGREQAHKHIHYVTLHAANELAVRLQGRSGI